MVDRCEPPPELRGMDGWHWLTYPDAPDEPAHWQASNQSWLLPGHDDYVTPDFMLLDEGGTRYLAPVATPAEVEALRAERDAAIARTAAACANAVEAYDEIRTVRDALKSRVDALERALRDAALQLAYLDERSPSGTTPTIIARILAALEATP